MKILHLRLENFVTCENIDLDLRRTNIVGVYGPNASGKTTIFIDSVLFALYGYEWVRSRKIKLEDLIMSGKSYCRVSLTFETLDESNERRVYEVCRVIKRGGTGYVELFEVNGKQKKRIAHGDRAVTPYLKKLMKLGCKTFLATVAVRQGEVLQIAKGTPGERRELLLRLLGLRLEKAREVAKERYANIKQELSALTTKINLYKKEISKKDSIINEISKYKAELDKVLNSINYLNSKKDEINLAIKETRARLLELSEIKGRINSIKSSILDIDKNIREINSEITKLNKIFNNKIDSCQIDSIILEISNIKNIIEQNMDYIQNLKHNYNKLEGKLDKLKKIYQRYYQRKAGLEKQLLKSFANCSKVLGKEIRSAQTLLKEYELLRNRLLKILGEKSTIESKLELAENSLELLKKAESKCPLCGADLPQEKKNSLIDRYYQNVILYKSKLKKLEKEKESLKNTINAIERTVDYVQRLSASLDDIDTQIKDLQEEILETEREVSSLKNKIDNLKSNILVKIGKSIMSSMVSAYSDISDLYRTIVSVLSNIQSIKANLKNLSALLLQKRKLLDELEKLKPFDKIYDDTKLKLSNLEQALKRIDHKIDCLRKDEVSLKSAIKSLEMKLIEIQAYEKELPNLEKKAKELKRKEKVYNVLANRVFSDRGLPSALLRAYAERIENKVNNVLSLIWSPDYRVRVKVSRDGGVDLECARRDFLGVYKPRPLETFSGGESTAIGFALRLAFSEILAEEYGARVNVLIIDEGFSQLDREHREALVELLKRLVNTGIYDQVIAISHIDDVMDYFEEKIRVFRDNKERTQIEFEKGSLSY